MFIKALANDWYSGILALIKKQLSYVDIKGAELIEG